MNGDMGIEMASQQTDQPQAGPSNTQNGPEATSTGPTLPIGEVSRVVPTTDKPAGQPTRNGPKAPQQPLEPLQDLITRRVTRIKEGDNVLLRLPSDTVKAVVASKEGIVQLGKYGGFPAHLLIGLYFDITYEIVQSTAPLDTAASAAGEEALMGDGVDTSAGFGQKKGKKNKKREKGKGDGGSFRSNPAWRNELRPFRSRALVDAVIDDIQETNEFIDDSGPAQASFLSQEEIAELKAQGISAEEMMQRQIERHGKFELKTDFSKEKWRKRKEKKFSQTVLPIAPTAANICLHYLTRSPISILHMRDDTLSQLLSHSNVRPGGRYLVADDTGGLVTSAMMERMGCDGRILTFADADSPPAWGVLSVMNWSERELECVKWLNWLEAEEDYEKPPPPDEDSLPTVAAHKTTARQRRHEKQVAELNVTRNELHLGHWDGLVIATELSPLSVLARLTPYLSGSGTIVIYSPYIQVLVDILAYTKKNPNYLAPNLTESWTRTYQVLPGRTHPLMTTSATGGYLLHAIRVLPSPLDPNFEPRHKRRKTNKPKSKKGDTGASQNGKAGSEGDAASSLGDDEAVELVDGLTAA